MDDTASDTRLAELQAQHGRTIDILAGLSAQLTKQGTQDATQWLRDIERINRQDDKTNVIIGIVGATGAGKSALINALLDEERILPTNCMRACTAVVTEIAYNEQDIPYRAEIHFISKDAWRADLTATIGDITDDSGQFCSSVYRDNTEAGIAYAKVKAVYPQMTRDEIIRASADQLVTHESVCMLGTMAVIEEHQSDMFYSSLQKFVDSKEKALKPGSKSQKDQDSCTLEYWPLIKVVKIYLKAPILQSGAILVDLPGTQDSNAARAAIAQNYLKQCSSLIIVAPINRAVDDKAAKSLLGDSFKQQLKLDGHFSNVIFVCSKTDEISLTEADDTLGLVSETGSLWQRRRELEDLEDEAENERSELTAKIEKCEDILARLRSDIQETPSLQRKAELGKQGCTPTITNYFQKRKTELASEGKLSKKPRLTDDAGDDLHREVSDNDNSFGIEKGFVALEHVPEKPPDAATIEATGNRLLEHEHRTSVELSEHNSILRQQTLISKLRKKEIADVCQNLYKITIKARNEYARDAIRADFALGIQEMDHTMAHIADPENFDPSIDQRDYEEIAHKLPVFCISSRGYQKLQGRLKKEKSANGYTCVQDTEIPALQAHCFDMTRELRVRAHEDFINGYTQLCNSLRLWASGRDGDRNLTEAELTMAQTALSKDSKDMSRITDAAGRKVLFNIAKVVDIRIYSKFDAAIAQAKVKADEVQAHWNGATDATTRAGRGLHHCTYKATVRRNGTFGTHDFNNDLATPVKDILTHGWEAAFVRGIPKELSKFAETFEAQLAHFHDAACQTAAHYGASEISLKMFLEQMTAYVKSIKTTIRQICKRLKVEQKEITRQFGHCISDEMRATYEQCASQIGTGMLMRMRREMSMGLAATKQTMFRASTQHIRQQIEHLLSRISRDFTEQVKAVTDNVERDYSNLFGQQGQARLEQQKLFRQDLIAILDDTAADNVVTLSDSAQIPLQPQPEAFEGAQSVESTATDLPVQIKAEPDYTASDAMRSILAFRSASPDIKPAI